jgi:hypothetical protein
MNVKAGAVPEDDPGGDAGLGSYPGRGARGCCHLGIEGHGKAKFMDKRSE